VADVVDQAAVEVEVDKRVTPGVGLRVAIAIL